MADGAKSTIGQIASDIGEAVVEPVKDEVGKAIESGVQSVAPVPKAKPLDPVAQQRKQVENQKKQDWALRVIRWNQNIQQAQQKVRQDQQQEQMKKNQEEEEKKKVKQYKVIEQQQKRQQMDAVVQQAQTRTETKKGVGG